METVSVQPDKIHISRIDIFKNNIEASNDYLNDRVIPASYKFSFSQNTGLDLEQHVVGIRLHILVDSQDENEQTLGLNAHFGIEFELEVENLKDFVQVKNNGKTTLDSVFAATIMGIAYSTARGIIFQTTANTLLSSITLPVIDPSTLLTKH